MKNKRKREKGQKEKDSKCKKERKMKYIRGKERIEKLKKVRMCYEKIRPSILKKE